MTTPGDPAFPPYPRRHRHSRPAAMRTRPSAPGRHGGGHGRAPRAPEACALDGVTARAARAGAAFHWSPLLAGPENLRCAGDVGSRVLGFQYLAYREPAPELLPHRVVLILRRSPTERPDQLGRCLAIGIKAVSLDFTSRISPRTEYAGQLRDVHHLALEHHGNRRRKARPQRPTAPGSGRRP